MSAQKLFILDANVLIDAHRQLYCFDFCPGFWAAIDRGFRDGEVFSIDKVKEELLVGKDWLKTWATRRRLKRNDGFWRNTATMEVAAEYSKIMNWVRGETQFFERAKEAFAQTTDAWIVAYAMRVRGTVVTSEEYSPEIKREVKIPNVCTAFQVPFCRTFEMLRELNVSLALRKRPKAT